MTESSSVHFEKSVMQAAPDKSPSRVFQTLGWAGLFFVLALFPGVLFSQLLKELNDNWVAETKQQQFQSASEFLAEIEREFQVAPIIQRILQNLSRKAITGNLSASEAVRLEKWVRGKLPAQSRFYWFDQSCRLVLAPGGKGGGTRVWQGLAKFLLKTPDCTEADRTLAFNLMKSLMGELISPKIVEQGINQVIEILCDTQLFFFSMTTLGNSTSTDNEPRNSVIALIPQKVFSRDWEVKRAIKLLSRPNRWVGGYRISTGKAFGIGGLNENLLVGLAQNLRQGQPETLIGKEFYLAACRKEDPDLMLVSGVIDKSGVSDYVPMILQTGRVLIWAILFFIGWRFLGFILGRQPPHFSLTGKFFLGTILLVALPVVVILMQGMSQIALMNKVEETVQEQHLSSALLFLEQGVASKISRARTRLRRLTRSSDLVKGVGQARLSSLLQQIFPLKGLQYMYLHTSGLKWSHGLEEGTMETRARMDFVNQILKKSSFSFPDHLTATSTPFMGGALGDLIAGNEFWENVLEKLEPQQVGSAEWYLYLGFSNDMQGTPVAFVFISIPVDSLRDKYLAETRMGLASRSSEIQVFLEGEKAPLPLINQFLGQTTQEDRPFRTTLRHNGVSCLAIGRPLRGLSKRALVLSPKKEGISTVLTRRKLLGLLFLAFLVAVIAAAGLRQIFLEPVQEISNAVQTIDSGSHSPPLEPRCGDELGTLMVRFNGMDEQLKQKARMAGFVRGDLLSDPNRTASAGACRQRLAVSFAGLRNFSAIEADLAPEKAMETMSKFLETCNESVQKAGGQIDKFIGDSAMAVFLFEDSAGPAPEKRAVDAALMLVNSMEIWNNERFCAGLPPLNFGIGLNMGEAITGNIGSRLKRLDFTAIGDTINLAARLEKLAGRGETPKILGAGDVFRVAVPGFEWVLQTVSGVRGKKESIEIRGLVETDCTRSVDK